MAPTGSAIGILKCILSHFFGRQLFFFTYYGNDPLAHVTNKPHLGYVAEHGSRDRPAQSGDSK